MNIYRARSELRPRLRDYLERRGINTRKPFLCLHPDHADHNPSMSLFTGSDGVPRVKCFSCGAHGDVFDVAAWETGSRDFSGNVEHVCEVLGLDASRYLDEF